MYESLKEVYTTSLGKLYDRDLRGLFNTAREKIAGIIFIYILYAQIILFKGPAYNLREVCVCHFIIQSWHT